MGNTLGHWYRNISLTRPQKQQEKYNSSSRTASKYMQTTSKQDKVYLSSKRQKATDADGAQRGQHLCISTRM